MWYVLSESAELDKTAHSVRVLLIMLFPIKYVLLQISHRMGFSAMLRFYNHLSKSPLALILDAFSFANRKTFSPPSTSRPFCATSCYSISRLQIRMCRSFQNRIRMPCSPHPKNKVVPVKIHIFCQNWLLCSTLTTGSSHVGSAWFRQWVQRALHDSDSGFNSVSELALTSS